MKLFQKIKEALFEEEEYTEQIKITPEMRNEATPAKEVVKEEPVKKEEVPEPPVIERSEPKEVPKIQNETLSERELFNTKPNFPFFDFDEKEFESQNNLEPPKAPERPRQANVLEFERKKKAERHTDFGRYEKTEMVETIERKKFKPSPIISPVYGILDKDYVKSDIVQRSNPDKVDIQMVRNKAFGEKKEEIKSEPIPTFYEESETVTISEPEEKEKKVKTIDELLENTSDVEVDIDNDLEIPDQVEEPLEPIKEEVVEHVNQTKEPEVEDTLENDLFDLIDSMYSNKEDGE